MMLASPRRHVPDAWTHLAATHDGLFVDGSAGRACRAAPTTTSTGRCASPRYNISWELTVMDVVNASLRQRMILANCEHAKVGDQNCDPECSHPLTGYDGGDCQPPSGHHPSSSSGHAANCDWDTMANDVCDPECDTAENAFDNGDCCEQISGKVTRTCFDPESPNRVTPGVTPPPHGFRTTVIGSDCESSSS
ncbi:unnamed protein product [Lampetra fluviatilis]